MISMIIPVLLEYTPNLPKDVKFQDPARCSGARGRGPTERRRVHPVRLWVLRLGTLWENRNRLVHRLDHCRAAPKVRDRRADILT